MGGAGVFCPTAGTGVGGAGVGGAGVGGASVGVFGVSMMTEKVGAVVTYWPTALPVGVRVTTFVLAVTNVVVTEMVFAVASPDAHVRNAGL